jgi:hypothetical protein
MKLNIITVLFRKVFLEKQMRSIPKKNDINWIICKTKEWGEIPKSITENKNINLTIISEIDCEDNKENFIKKINQGLCLVEDGFFYILDDDNIIHSDMYEIYNDNKCNYEMIVGKQIRKNGKVYLSPNYPEQNLVDMGNVICTTKILKDVDYFNKIDKDYFAYDGQFWSLCFSKLNKEKVALINKPMFYYNGLR